MAISRRNILLAAAAAPVATLPLAGPAEAASGKTGGAPAANAAGLALKPPMGWNSWNSFAGTIDETQALETAAIMRDRLLPSGYDTFTVDIQWYEPEAKGYTYNTHPVPSLDAYGRLTPAPNRFPSAADGKGFAPLAEKVHAMGMKFGIHVMRGIARRAVELNLPILGTDLRAADIADTTSTCAWNPDMYGVDMRKPGAQEYYDGLFRLYAAWGVDFVKMDDMSRPYDAHAPEIEAAAQAISRCGRPIVLSLSPGETPLLRGDHVRRHAQMWRISDDFWDDWSLLEAQFTRLENWTPYRAPGSWPDADMLPLGRLALGDRDTRFTTDEQRTLMTLWSIARSPLIMGGDLRYLDKPTLDLLTNPGVLAVNQASTGNCPHYVEDGMKAWSAWSEDGSDRYLALFNVTDEARECGIALRQLGMAGPVAVYDVWQGAEIGNEAERVSSRLAPHASALYRLRRT
ncbi:glycoside hydrolase family 27 protein [Novosphingobium malaysiense]|uniref:Alpha-galactosidase n=1 Tax=Novosphingobium malaysiense TaxID=1348853 RepID=A0A0B1ZNX1_9SPHN|nr:glycoside hydrolase family 27 protein [Novosphingobium malaysiense]KHK90964.1 alpha-galactosidase [Novosphingobium malaysiense]